MAKITKSFRVEPELWREIKIHVAKENTDISKWLEKIIKENLKKK